MRSLIAFLLLLCSHQAFACQWLEVSRALTNAYQTDYACGQNGRVWRATYTLVQRDTCTGDLRTDTFSLDECREPGGGGGCFDYTSCGSCQSNGMKQCLTYTCDGSPVGSSYWKSCGG